ncbi:MULTISPECIES: hypothetical protein [unclassified Streptomyces]|uniref:hypothetical protein n=1 Tax=unclassified Streptomyces TaxID=2593676 RepID=UPI00081F18A4|nr:MULTISPECIES: hypothetical protein [unclassified Streptomyces]SCE86685.1 hypothetical protein GA0115257_103611 [Streptomyces sp. LcepLS]
MALRRTFRRTLLAAVVLSTSVLTTPSAHAAPLPPACQDALLKTLDKFPSRTSPCPRRRRPRCSTRSGR